MNAYRGIVWTAGLVGLTILASASIAPARGDEPGVPFAPSSATETVLRIARSTDGLTFDDAGGVFLRYAGAPDIEVLPNGDVLAVFDYVGTDNPDTGVQLAVARSGDGGRSWTQARPIRFQGRLHGSRCISHADLALMPGGGNRLHFQSVACHSLRGDTGRSRGLPVVGSALTRNGLAYRLDRATRVRVGRGGVVHPMTVWFGDALHLYAAEQGSSFGSDSGMSAIRHFVSPDGRQFVRLRSFRVPDVSFVGSLLAIEGGIRAYVSGAEGIMSLVSRNGRDWERESGLRLTAGWDPAVARLEDGSYLMLYCAPIGREHVASSQLVDVSSYLAGIDDGQNIADETAWVDFDNYEDQDADASAYADAQDAVGLEPEDDVDAEGRSADGRGDAGDHAADPGTVSDEYDSEVQAAAQRRDEEEDAVTGFEDWDPVASDGFAPRPDFKTKIEYLEWYRRYAMDHPEDNAFWSYASFMPGTPGDPANKPEWPEFNDMFNGDYDGPPMPWDPADHPEWEASYQAAQEVLARYREATTHEGYASPPYVEVDGAKSPRDMDDLLIGILLPSLSPHRAMSKATLAASWRLEDGKVSGKRMIDAWETTLRGANHVGSGATIIEDLVGMAERALVQKNARRALKHDVFSGDELETAFDTLREYDRDERGMGDRIRGEHAMCMDMAQYLYMPPNADGTPAPNVEQRLTDMFDFSDEMVDRLLSMEPNEVRTSLDAFDAHYRELDEKTSIGYPEVRTADIAELTKRNRPATPLTDFLVPDLSRYYQLRARSEASRRATQLAYATRLFKERNGRWPESLSELPAEYGETMRTDPFSGRDFGYRVTDDGPRIYSASENGIDDGGTHSRRWNDEITNDAGSDDYVFWPPQPKR